MWGVLCLFAISRRRLVAQRLMEKFQLHFPEAQYHLSKQYNIGKEKRNYAKAKMGEPCIFSDYDLTGSGYMQDIRNVYILWRGSRLSIESNLEKIIDVSSVGPAMHVEGHVSPSTVVLERIRLACGQKTADMIKRVTDEQIFSVSMKWQQMLLRRRRTPKKPSYDEIRFYRRRLRADAARVNRKFGELPSDAAEDYE